MTGNARGAIRDFKYEGDDGKAQEIEAVVDLKSYLVKYRDAEGKTKVRLAFVVPGTDTGFVGQESIQGSPVFAPMTGWFLKQLKEKTGQDSGEEAESI
jgi:hypothetical protein